MLFNIDDSTDTVLIHIGVNDILQSVSNMERLLLNVREMVRKCRLFGVKNMFVSGLVYTRRIRVNILNDLQRKLVDICREMNVYYIDDTNPYVCNKNLDFALEQLELQSNIAIKWFEDNQMKMNASKCHLFVSGNKYEHMWARVGNDLIWESRTIKLLGTTIDNELKFDVHISNICKKAQRKLTILMRLKKLRILFKTFFESQFKYCPLTWMFYSRGTNNKINRLKERALRFVYDDYSFVFL